MCKFPNDINFTKFSNFGGTCNNAALLIQAKFGIRQYTHGLHWYAKFHLNVLTVGFQGPKKTQFWKNFDIGGTHAPMPVTDKGQIWCAGADPQSMLTCQISSRLVYSVAFWRRKTPQILPSYWFWHFVVSPVGYDDNLRKLHNHKPSSIQWYQNCFCTPASWRNRAHKLMKCSE